MIVDKQLNQFLETYFNTPENIYASSGITQNLSDFTLTRFIKENDAKNFKFLANDFCFGIFNKLETETKNSKKKNEKEIEKFNLQLINHKTRDTSLSVMTIENFEFDDREENEEKKRRKLKIVNNTELLFEDNRNLKMKKIVPILNEEHRKSFSIDPESDFKTKKFKIENSENLLIKGKKRNYIRSDSLKRYKILAQNTRVKSVNNKASVDNIVSLQLTPIKTEPKVEICSTLSFDICKNGIFKTESSKQNTISNNFNYNFNYSYLPSLENYEYNIKNYSPIPFKQSQMGNDIKELESVYNNIKRDFTELKPLLQQDKNIRTKFFKNLSEGNENKYVFFKNLFKLVINEDNNKIGMNTTFNTDPKMNMFYTKIEKMKFKKNSADFHSYFPTIVGKSENKSKSRNSSLSKIPTQKNSTKAPILGRILNRTENKI